MKTLDNTISSRPGITQRLANMLKKLGNSINGLFTPEEVEVTFTKVGNNINYTYTIIHHKQVA